MGLGDVIGEGFGGLMGGLVEDGIFARIRNH